MALSLYDVGNAFYCCAIVWLCIAVTVLASFAFVRIVRYAHKSDTSMMMSVLASLLYCAVSVIYVAAIWFLFHIHNMA